MRRRLLVLGLLAVAGFLLGGGLALLLRDDVLAVIVPLLGVALAFLIARSVMPARLLPLVPAVAVQGGHALWLLFGVVTLGLWGGLLLDVLPFLAVLVWVLRRPVPEAAGTLVALHSLKILLDLVQLARTTDPADALPWVLAHAGLRMLSIALTLRGLYTIWRRTAWVTAVGRA